VLAGWAIYKISSGYGYFHYGKTLTQVILPSFRLRKAAVMTLRSEANLQALKDQAAR
jgi:hypothetical protein